MQRAHIDDFLEQASGLCNAALEATLPMENIEPQRLHQAMRYAVFAGGKRLRPALVLASAQSLKAEANDCAALMAGIELLHTYTLVHDDLPAMDDDDMRRGRPSCHIAFDQATAILCGDALLTMAMECMAKHSAEAVCILAQACGSTGVVGGQQDDLDAENQELEDDAAWILLQRIQQRKTAALIRASCELGALAAQASIQQQQQLASFGEHIGCAFQITDDILDVTANAKSLGKTPGKDRTSNKLTSVSLLGIEGAQHAANKHLEQANAALTSFSGNSTTLQALAQFVISRGH
ncbi:MAG: polyprenyl synthetase family protein [Planctomycetes bacterium]|nr:polyprenyl synthetase family protein [Planctomycetota bacterium]